MLFADGIELQGSGIVPWEAIRAVVIDRRRVWLDLHAGYVTDLVHDESPWLTARHVDLCGEGGGGYIHVALRWIQASPDQIARQIARFTQVPVRIVAGRG